MLTLEGITVNLITVDRSGNLWLGTSSRGLVKFTHDPFNPSSLSWAYVQTLFADRFNNLWVGTSRGLNKADLTRWQMGFMNVNLEDGVQAYRFNENSFYKTGRGKLIFGGIASEVRGISAFVVSWVEGERQVFQYRNENRF